MENLISDPGERPLISSYDINIQDTVRRAYLQKGPCQPRGHDFPFSQCGNKSRRFCPFWFDFRPFQLRFFTNWDAGHKQRQNNLKDIFYNFFKVDEEEIDKKVRIFEKNM